MPSPFAKFLSPHKTKKEDDENRGEETPQNEQKMPLLARQVVPAPPSSTSEKYSSIRSTRSWNVKMPPPKHHMVHGKLMPSVTGTFTGRLRQKTSKIVVEIHSPTSLLGSTGGSPEITSKTGDSSPTQSAASVKKTTPIMRGLLRGKSMIHPKTEVLHDGETVVMRILRRSKRGQRDHGDDDDDDDSDDDDQSVSTLGLKGADDEELEDGKWSEAYHFDLDSVEVLKQHRHYADLKLGRGAETQVRTVNFATAEEAQSFCDILESLRKLEAQRAQRKLDAYRSGQTGGTRDFEAGEQINILVEIVSGVRLPIADISSTDAYVVVYLGTTEVHRTKQIPNT
jgi:hypothetical protein